MKAGLIHITLLKVVKSLLLLTWLLFYKAPDVVWAQSLQHNLYLNNEIKFEMLGIEQGLNYKVNNLMQDRKGFMWFATLDGLYKYDGYTFIHYQHDPRNINSLADNSVTSLYADNNGLIWIGFGGGGGVNSFNPQTDHWTHYAHDPKNPNSLTYGAIHTIQQDQAGIMWFGSLNGGISRFDPKKNLFTHFRHDPKKPYSISNNRVPALFVDKTGQLWVGTSTGLDLFDPKTNHFHHIRGNGSDTTFLTHTEVHHIYQDVKGLLWLSTLSKGVFVLDPVTKEFQAHYEQNPKQSNSLSSNYVISLTHDKKGYCWISTGKGLNKLDVQTGQFSLYEHEQYMTKTTHAHMIITDQSGLIWLSTGNGALYFSPKSRKFYRYLNEANDAFGPAVNEISSIFKGSDGQIYVVTSYSLLRFNQEKKEFELVYKSVKEKDEENAPWLTAGCEEKPGVFLLAAMTKGIVRFDTHINTITYLQHDPQDSNSIAHNDVDVLFKDTKGVVWVGNANRQLQWYDAAKKKFINYPYQTEADQTEFDVEGVRFIYEDKKGNLWLATKTGFYYTGGGGLFQINRKEGKITHYKYKENLPNSLSNNVVTCLYEDENGIIWVGTYGGGLNRLDPTKGTITFYTKEDGLQTNKIDGLTGDNRGNIWILTSWGITSFNTTTLKSDRFDINDGVGGAPLDIQGLGREAQGTTFKDANGTIYFGSNNGLTVFHPQHIYLNSYKPSIAINHFKVFDKALAFNEKGIELNHDQNFFNFEFAALSYLSSGKNQYAYKLEGLDKEWVYSGTRRIAPYTDVRPGTYVFRVKAANNDGVWNEEGISIPIIIHPPWWLTPWAYVGYALLAIGAAYSSYRYLLTKERLKHDLDLKKMEAEKLQEMDQIKSRFFTNISHEFRTPLTLILGPVQHMLTHVVEEGQVRKNHQLIYSNAHRLLELINQLLDISKLEAGSMALNLQKADIVKKLRTIVFSFASLAESKGIRLSFDASQENIFTHFDKDKFEKIINNLLSNAFKFTPADGSITVKFALLSSQEPQQKNAKGKKQQKEPSTQFVEISIADTGIGIAKERVAKIFDRFYQVDASATREQGGSGIGLALVKELVELHKGEIKVESEEGKGTVFTICLPMINDFANEDQRQENKEEELYLENQSFTGVVSETITEPLSEELTDSSLKEKEQLPLLLIVEDNPDVATFIKDTFARQYVVVEARDGQEGLELAIERIPDLVISDWMMPKMDGLSLCNKLKKDEKTSHIPIILLTAKAKVESKLEGLQIGADDYLTKPFHTEELLVRVKNLIEGRKKLQERYGRELTLQPAAVTVSSTDERFLQKVITIMEANVSNADFDVETFGKEIGMSRMQLHRKLTALLDQTPNEFIRSFRLKRAVMLLDQNYGNISDVAFSVGFNSLTYFTKCFRDQYGKTPSEYLAHQAAHPQA